MPDTDQRHRCYAIRRLNPFLGVVQILQTEASRAISTDGLHWEIQIWVKQPDNLWGGEGPGEPVYRYIRFGNWSEDEGLRQVPAHPFLDLKHLFTQVDEIIALLAAESKQLPFPLADHHELWLLDGDDRLPLALLQSGVSQIKANTPTAHQWSASEATTEDFPSADADRLQPPHPRDTNPHPHISALTHIMRDNAGHSLAQWFRRDGDGSGTALPLSGFPDLGNRRLQADAFPQLLLRPLHQDPYEQALIRDFIAWRAPELLTLQHLDDDTRWKLEQLARRQALKVEALWRLYPKCADPGFLNAARVEARLRNAASQGLS